MNEDSYVILKNETDFQIGLRVQAAPFFKCFFLSLQFLPIMKIYFTENIFTKTHNYI